MNIETLERKLGDLIKNKERYFSCVLPYKDVLDHISFYSECLDNDCDIYYIFEAESLYKCEYCDQWQTPNLKCDYVEACDSLGYNPPTSPDLYYSDSHFYCTFCGEYNFIDLEELNECIEEEKLKYINYKITDKMYIFNERASDIENSIFTLDQDEIYERYNRKESPINYLSNNQIMIHFASCGDNIEKISEVFIYKPYYVWEYMDKK